MYQVGTQVGDVHQQRQGTGLATVLQDTEMADDYFLKYMGQRQADLAAKAKDDETKRNAALAKLNALGPTDYFDNDQLAIAEQTRKTQELGMQAMKAGVVDPALGTDAVSQAYQKELTRLQQMGVVSKQRKDRYTAFRNDIDAKGANTIDTDSILAADAYFKGDLNEIMADPKKNMMPVIKQRQPYKDVLTVSSTLAGKVKEGIAEGAEADPNTVRKMVRASFADAESGEIMVQSFDRTLKNLPKAQQDDIEARARVAGITPPEQLLYDMTMDQIADPAPYNAADALAKAANGFKVSTSEYRGAETFSKGVREGETMKSAMAEAKILMNQKPDAFPAWAQYFGMKQGTESEEAFRTKVQTEIAKEIYRLAPKDVASGVTPGSGKNPEKQKRSSDWLATVYGDDLVASQQAMDMLRGIDYGQGLTIDRAEINQFGDKTNNRYATFDLRGDVKSRLSKEELAKTFSIDPKAITELKSSEDVESGQYKTTIQIRLSPTNAGFLQSFYNDAEKNDRQWLGTQNLPQYVPAQNVETILQGRQVDFAIPANMTPQPKAAPTYNYKSK